MIADIRRTMKTVCLSIALSTILGAGLSSKTQQDPPTPRMLHFSEGVPIAKQLNPDDRLVIVYRIQSRPPVEKLLTLQQDLERITTFADAIAIVDIQHMEGIPTSAGDWATTKIRGKIVDLVKSSDRSSLGEPNGSVTFEFDGGELSIGSTLVRVGDYPLLTIGDRYLIMFQLHPSGLRWFPFQPFRVGTTGRLERVKFFSADPVPYTSPLEGQLLTTITKELRKK